jgi:hypothetical protein
MLSDSETAQTLELLRFLTSFGMTKKLKFFPAFVGVFHQQQKRRL